MRLVCDIETNGLLDTVHTIWCIGAVDLDSDKEYLFTPDTIREGIELLESADRLYFHNMRYDLEVFKKLYNIDWYHKTLDTVIMTKIETPFLRPIKGYAPRPFSLKAFGARFKFPKGDYNDWSGYTTEMGEYCLQDCRITKRIVTRLYERGYDFESDWNKLEHRFAQLQQEAVNHGVWLDQDLMHKTLLEINTKMNNIQRSVDKKLGYSYTPFEYNLKKDGTLPHYAIKKIAQIELEYPDEEVKVNYNKDKTKCQVMYPMKITLDTKKTLIEKLIEFGWKPVFYTEPSKTHPKGQPQLVRDGEVDPNLCNLGEEYKEFADYFMLKHRNGLINGFKKLLRPDGKVASDADTVGAVTGRVTHKGIANFPAVRSPYGEVIRSMFGVKPDSGRTMVGSDLAGIEARLLAHYMNDEDYTHEVLNGDIHTKNQESAGLPTRDSAKTFFYGFMYGAGDAKIGELVGGGAKQGKKIKNQFLESLPSLKDLIEYKQKEALKGYVSVLGDRPVKITKSKDYAGVQRYDVRKALNSLLQGSGATYFKKWAVIIDEKVKELGLDAKIMILYHDEVQIDCKTEDVDTLKQVLKEAVVEADKYFKVNCKNDIDTKTGVNWFDTH